jgi:two-component system chemotaxis response regulator CheB
MSKIRLVVIDESSDTRDLIHRALTTVADIDLLFVAPSARAGLAWAEQGKADLVVISSEIDDMRLAEAAQQIRELPSRPGMLIACPARAAETAPIQRVLARGAAEVVIKPDVEDPGLWQEVFQRRVLPKIRSISAARYTRQVRSTAKTPPPVTPVPATPIATPRPLAVRSGSGKGLELIVVGVSTGGPDALAVLLQGFPSGFPVPIVTVIHMPQQFSGSLAKVLERSSPLDIKVGVDGECVEPGCVYLSSGGVHLSVERATRGRMRLVMRDAPPEGGCKPSVNVLFESAAETCHGAVLAVIMTGMGDDGVRGLARLKEHGAHVLAQDEATSVVWGMPGSAARAGLVDEVLPLQRLSSRIIELVGVR